MESKTYLNSQVSEEISDDMMIGEKVEVLYLEKKGGYREQLQGLLGTELTLHIVLSCPCGSTYFLRFLQQELCEENLTCYYENKALIDFLEIKLQQYKHMGSNYDVQNEKGLLKELYDMASKQLIEDYIVTTSPHEVNLSSKVRKRVIESIESLNPSRFTLSEQYPQPTMNNVTKDDVTSEENIKSFEIPFEEIIKGVKSSLNILGKELVRNLDDPFGRFFFSPLAAEMMTSFSLRCDAKKSYEYYCGKILSPEKDEVIMNELSGSWTEGVKVRHPLTIVQSTLNLLKEKLVSGFSSYWTFIHKEDRMEINLSELIKNSDLKYVTVMSSELAMVNLDLLKTSEEKLCFFLNLYNLMVIHAVILNQAAIPQVTTNRLSFMKRMKYKVGHLLFSLDDIEGGILQGNPRTSLFGSRRFGPSDKRASYVIRNAPKDHFFAKLTLTSQSPNLMILSEHSIQADLKKMREEYFENKIKSTENHIFIPMLLRQNVQFVLDDMKKIGNCPLSLNSALKSLVIKQYIKNSSISDSNTPSLYKFSFVVDIPKCDFSCLINQEQKLTFIKSISQKRERRNATFKVCFVPVNDE